MCTPTHTTGILYLDRLLARVLFTFHLSFAMYGFVNRALENLIVRKYGGRPVWEKIRELAALKPEERQELQERQVYDDSYTYRLLNKASEVCGVSQTEVLEGFGEQFFMWCREFGYDRTLQALGATVRDFLCNLDALHDHLATNMFPDMRAPSFRCSDGPNGEIYLHYYSARRGLQQIVIGIIKTVCRQLHNTVVRMDIIQEVDGFHDHVVFAIRELGPVSGVRETSMVRRQQSFKPDLSYIERLSWSPVPAVQFCQIFPFHIIFDDQQRLCQLGTSLFRVVTTYNIDIQNVKLTDLFDVERPQGMSFNFTDIKSHINMVFILQSKNSSPTEALRLKGQMVCLHEVDDSAGKMLFLCSPRIGDLSELSGWRLYLSDLPLHDATRDLILMDDTRANQHGQIVKLEEMNTKLNVAHQELADAHQDLEKEKDLTDKLLYSMFPIHVASQLKQNEEVAAETFPSVTILFSDIVGFTAICGKCHPSQVICMLDSLYKEFDAVTRENKLYKVETIGDAYMVVGGLTSRTDCHEEMVCNQALDMIAVVGKVTNPIDTGDHIHIRVGIHSGEVMAGVVGHLMPRYCLFGDTVNIASRTESTGVADNIQVTEATYKGLEMKPQFVFEEPHVVGMKNVRRPMVCYFLKENRQRLKRRQELLRRRTSVFIMSASQRKEVETHEREQRTNAGSKLEQTVSTVSEESEPVKSSQLVEETTAVKQQTEMGEAAEETVQPNEDTDILARREAMEGDIVNHCRTNRTMKSQSSVVWLLVAFLVAAIAASMHFYW